MGAQDNARPTMSPVRGGFSHELRRAADAIWEAQHAHPFVRGIGDGSLPEERFRFYVRQDYLFLVEYGRLLSLGAARAPRLDWMRRFAGLSHSVLETEMELHRQLASRWGIANAELEAERAAPATRAYCDFLLRTAALGDFGELVAALLPCMWGYSEIGERLAAAGAPPEHDGYREWIELYASPEFGELAAWCRGLADEVGAGAGLELRERMHRAFLASSELELGFWEGAWTSAGA
jgi:thiaminase/transcriptional activator TenA